MSNSLTIFEREPPNNLEDYFYDTNPDSGLDPIRTIGTENTYTTISIFEYLDDNYSYTFEEKAKYDNNDYYINGLRYI